MKKIQKIEDSEEFAEILNMPVHEIVTNYANCTKEQLSSIMCKSELLLTDLRELVECLREIQAIPCVFEHDRTGRFLPAECNIADINAGCGHQGNTDYEYENPTRSLSSSLNESAAKAIEKSLDVLEALGEDVRDDRSKLRTIAGKLLHVDRMVPRKVITGVESTIEDVPELKKDQQMYAEKLLTLRNNVMSRLIKKIKKIHAGEMPTSRFKEYLSDLEISPMFGYT